MATSISIYVALPVLLMCTYRRVIYTFTAFFLPSCIQTFVLFNAILHSKDAFPTRGHRGFITPLLHSLYSQDVRPHCTDMLEMIIRTDMQYASFQDKYHLYFLFDLLPGGDLMDILVAEAKVVTHRAANGQLSCFQTKTKVLKVGT
jgi:hypothetical protein